MTLNTPVKDAGRIYKTYASRLEKLAITTLEDFLFHIPFRYEDFSLITPIFSVQPGEKVTIQGRITSMKNEFTKRFKKLQKATIEDETGSIEAVWFNQPYLTQYIREGDLLSVSGRVELFGKHVVLQSPEYEVMTEQSVQLHTGRLVPVYPETRGVSSKWLRRQVHKLLTDHVDEIREYLPVSLLSIYDFPLLYDALREVHFPSSLESAHKAKSRLAFDELFMLQLAGIKRRESWERELKGHSMPHEPYAHELTKLRKSLPFSLTDAQHRAVSDMFSDMASEKPMNRLIQGDVGSGKTVVAAFGMFLAHLHNYQSVLMAPTEILAEQHYKTLSQFLTPLNVRVSLVTGSKKLAKDERFDILIGTHAVLVDSISFDRLGFIVIDEQQRFGVEQRSIIREKGDNPHFLTMTATPIPRTVALTLYGDLDLSYLNRLPQGRKTIKTWLVPEEKREGAYTWIRKQVRETDSQIFIICPFIEESENMQTVKAATVEFERLRKEVFPDLKLGMLHGKMKAKEKTEVLTDFKNRVYDILVATPVVEVGIDIPNATVIMIEAAERFGLAQLHQLRGRVGRGDKQSYCLLFTEGTSERTIERLKAMETSHNGAELAELDLKLRGPGELYGTLQSGSTGLKIASFSDLTLIQQARDEAKNIAPKLSDYPELEKKIEEITVKKVSPD